jgi:hypothetical protein
MVTSDPLDFQCFSVFNNPRVCQDQKPDRCRERYEPSHRWTAQRNIYDSRCRVAPVCTNMHEVNHCEDEYRRYKNKRLGIKEKD